MASGLRNFALFTDCANCSLFNFAMTRDTGDLALRGVKPYRVPYTFTIRHTALFAQISLQVDAFHASASSMTSRTASGERFFFRQVTLTLENEFQRVHQVCSGFKKFFKYATAAIDRIVPDLQRQPPQTVQRM